MINISGRLGFTGLLSILQFLFIEKTRAEKERSVGLSSIIGVSNFNEKYFEDDDFLLLKRLVRELKEIDRALILLHLEGQNSKEIADIMDTTQTNVTTKISRIKKRLKL